MIGSRGEPNTVIVLNRHSNNPISSSSSHPQITSSPILYQRSFFLQKVATNTETTTGQCTKGRLLNGTVRLHALSSKLRDHCKGGAERFQEPEVVDVRSETTFAGHRGCGCLHNAFTRSSQLKSQHRWWWIRKFYSWVATSNRWLLGECEPLEAVHVPGDYPTLTYTQASLSRLSGLKKRYGGTHL